MLFIIFAFLYYYMDDIYKRLRQKESIVIAERAEGCTLVPVRMTKYIIGGRAGINISVDDVPSANIKPGDTVLLPIGSGIRKISAYWYEADKHDTEARVDGDTMFFIYTKYDGSSTTTHIKELKKNEPVDESQMEKDHQKALSDSKSLKFLALFRPCIILIPLLIAATFLL
jgi:hypothetical protein